MGAQTSSNKWLAGENKKRFEKIESQLSDASLQAVVQPELWIGLRM